MTDTLRRHEREAEIAHTHATSLSAAELIEEIPGLVAVLAPDGRVERVNRQILEYTGQTIDELRDWGTNGTVHPEDLPHVAAVFGSSIATGTPYVIEQRLRRFDGEYRWFDNRGRPFRDANGAIVAWHVLLTDVDDRKQAEEAVRASERRLRQQTETFPQMLWSATAEGNIDYCNERLLEYSGLHAETVMGGGWVNLLHPDDREPTAMIWRRCIASGEPYSVEVRQFHAADRTYRWVLTLALPLRDDNGRILKWYGSCVDIHARKEAEEAIKASERRLGQIIDTIPAYVWSARGDGEVDFYNRQYLEYLGVPLEEIRGWKWTSVIHPEDLDAQLAIWRNALISGEPYESQMRVRRFDGTYRWFLVRTSRLNDGDGHGRWFGAAIDIEDRKHADERLRASELNLRQLTETIPQNLFGAAPNGLVNYLNPQMLDWFGRSDERIMAEEWVNLTHPDDRDATVAAWMGTVAAGTPYRREVRFMSRAGEYRWCEAQARPLRDGDGNIIAWHGVVNDIHDRKIAEDGLKASERNLRQTIDTIPALAWSARADGTADFFNRHYLDYVGFSLDDLRDWQWTRVIHPDDLPVIMQAWERFSADGTGGDVEARLRRYDGIYRWFSLRALPLRDDQGKVLKWYGVKVDIDDQKRATIMLAGERQLLELIASGRPLLEVLGALCAVVEAALPGCVCEVRTIDGSGTFFEHVAAPSLPADFTAAVALRPLAEDGSPWNLAARRKIQVVVDDIEVGLRWTDERVQMLLMDQGLRSTWCAPIKSKDGHVLGTLGLHHRSPPQLQPSHQDIIDRTAQIASIAIVRSRAEDELKRREFLLKTAERISETGSFSWDLANNKIVWSEQMFRIWEVEQTADLNPPALLPIVHPDDVALAEERIERIFRGENNPEREERIVMGDGRVKWLNTSTLLFNYEDGRQECVGVAQDITRRKHAEDALDKIRTELAHVTRVASLGELAASIAHEVNQPLSGIITNASTCLRMLESVPPDISGAIRTAQRSIRDGNRASEVIKRLRALYAKQDFHPEPFNLNEAAQEVIAICSHDLQRRQISLRSSLDPALRPVSGDRIQLQQVILNLVLNAADALGSVDRGTRQITVESTEAEPGMARFMVRDTGPGVAVENLDKIFDAFFTTKPHGMGIGLSVSKSIIDRHGGRLWTISDEGRGATFAFSIPCALKNGDSSAEA